VSAALPYRIERLHSTAKDRDEEIELKAQRNEKNEEAKHVNERGEQKRQNLTKRYILGKSDVGGGNRVDAEFARGAKKVKKGKVRKGDYSRIVEPATLLPADSLPVERETSEFIISDGSQYLIKRKVQSVPVLRWTPPFVPLPIPLGVSPATIPPCP